MSHDLIRNYIVKIDVFKEGEFKGSGAGVIFKASKNSQAFYILTAMHIFDGISANKLFLEEVEVKIFLESYRQNSNIVKSNIKVYSINEKEEDVAFIILKKENLTIDAEASICYLEFLDMDDNPYEKIDFFISGYPDHMSTESLTRLMHYNLKYLSSVGDNIFTRLYCTSSPTLLGYNKSQIIKNMSGISGAGIFTRNNTNTINLSHIHHRIPESNVFLATRADALIDNINDIILSEKNPSFSLIKTSTKVIIDDISLDEFQDFEFLKKKITNEMPSHTEAIKSKFSNISKLTGDIKNKDEIAKASRILKQIHGEIDLLSRSLSYMYANYAIAAHDNKSKRLTSLFFKKAIELNPEHKNTFMQEKAIRNNDSEKLKEIALNSLEDTINFYDKKMEECSQTGMEKILVTKEAIYAIMKFNNNKDTHSDQNLQRYLIELEESYKNNHTLRTPYKYKELGEFYIKILENEKALEKLYTSLFIFEGGPQTDATQLAIEEAKEIINSIEYENKNIELIKKTAQSIAMESLEQEEDKNIKEQLHRTNAMLSVIYDDIYHIKLEDNNQKQLSSKLTEKLHALKYQVEEQIDQNTRHNLNTLQINEAILALDTTTIKLTDQIKNTTIQYELKDEETRREVITTIQKSTDELNFVIDDFNTKSNNIIHDIDDHLDTLTMQKDTLLQDITSKLDKKLQEFNIYQENIAAENSEILKFLKNSERRMLSNINKLHISNHQRDETASLIRQSITQLQKSIKSADLTPAWSVTHKKTSNQYRK